MLQPCVLFLKFLQAGISATAVLAAGLKTEDGSVWCWHRASETAVLSHFCLGFQSPFQCRFKAWSCLSVLSGFTVLKSHILQVCHLIYVVETTIDLIIVFYFLNKDSWCPSFHEKGKVGMEYSAVAFAAAGSGDSVCPSTTEGISILGGKLPSLYLHRGATSFLNW